MGYWGLVFEGYIPNIAGDVTQIYSTKEASTIPLRHVQLVLLLHQPSEFWQ